MTLLLEDLTAEEIDVVKEMERRGIRFSSLVKGLIGGFREAASTVENLTIEIKRIPDTATVSPAEFSARLRAIPKSANPWSSVSVEDTSREAIYTDHN